MRARQLAIAGTTGMDAGYDAFDVVPCPGHLFGCTGTPLCVQWLGRDPTNVANHGSTAGQRLGLQ